MAQAFKLQDGAFTGAILLSTWILSSWGSAQAGGEPGLHQVLIQGGEFRPQTLEIKRGDRVQWINRDYIAHTATAQEEENRWSSGNLDKGESMEVVFNETGTMAYICLYHPTMFGTLIVKE